MRTAFLVFFLLTLTACGSSGSAPSSVSSGSVGADQLLAEQLSNGWYGTSADCSDCRLLWLGQSFTGENVEEYINGQDCMMDISVANGLLTINNVTDLSGNPGVSCGAIAGVYGVTVENGLLTLSNSSKTFQFEALN